MCYLLLDIVLKFNAGHNLVRKYSGPHFYVSFKLTNDALVYSYKLVFNNYVIINRQSNK